MSRVIARDAPKTSKEGSHSPLYFISAAGTEVFVEEHLGAHGVPGGVGA